MECVFCVHTAERKGGGGKKLQLFVGLSIIPNTFAEFLN